METEDLNLIQASRYTQEGKQEIFGKSGTEGPKQDWNLDRLKVTGEKGSTGERLAERSKGLGNDEEEERCITAYSQLPRRHTHTRHQSVSLSKLGPSYQLGDVDACKMHT